MKTAILAAGALAVATLTGAESASAKDAHFSLTLGSPGATLSISSPGTAYNAHGYKGQGYGYGYNPYTYGYNPYNYGYGYPYGGPRYGYGNGYKYHPKKKHRGRGHRPYRRHCMSPREIRWMLKSHGWYGFRLKKLTSNIAVVYSHRHGQRYRIKIDRCTRDILKVSPKGGYY